MSIHIYTGVPGSGKSAHAAMDIRLALTRRYPRPVIANFPLAPDAPVNPQRLAYYNYIPNEDMSAKVITDIARDYWATADEAFSEDHILLVLDECQLLFNSRTWNSRDRMQYLEFLSQSRKFGIKVILIAQATKMVDNQFRMLIEVEHNHRRLLGFGPIGWLISVPFGGRLFLVVRHLYQINERLGMEFIHPSKKDLAMYDSYGMFSTV